MNENEYLFYYRSFLDGPGPGIGWGPDLHGQSGYRFPIRAGRRDYLPGFRMGVYVDNPA